MTTTIRKVNPDAPSQGTQPKASTASARLLQTLTGRQPETLVAESYTYNKNLQRGDFSANITATGISGPYTVTITGPIPTEGITLETSEAAEYYAHHRLDELLPVGVSQEIESLTENPWKRYPGRKSYKVFIQTDLGRTVQAYADAYSKEEAFKKAMDHWFIREGEVYEWDAEEVGMAENPAYSQIGGRGWMQETYETASRDAGKRTRQLRKLGYSARSGAMGPQVTPVGIVKMTMVNIGPGSTGDEYLENVPPPEGGVVRLSNPSLPIVTVEAWNWLWSHPTYGLGLWQSQDLENAQSVADQRNEQAKREGRQPHHIVVRVPGMGYGVILDGTLERATRANPIIEPILGGAAAGAAVALTNKAIRERMNPVPRLEPNVFYYHDTKTGRRYYFWSRAAGRYMPTKKDYAEALIAQGKATAVPKRKGNPQGPAGPQARGRSSATRARQRTNPDAYPDTDGACNPEPTTERGGRAFKIGDIVTFRKGGKARVTSYIIYDDNSEGYGGTMIESRVDQFPPGSTVSFDDELIAHSNPDAYPDSERAAATFFEKFHGRPAEEIVTIPEDEHYHEWLGGIGDLVEIKVRTKSGYKVDLDFAGDNVMVAASEDGRQLYLTGGNQKLELKDLHMDGQKWQKDLMEIGEVEELTYRTEKDFDDNRATDYFHKLSEVTKGPKPSLLYDTLNDRLKIAGGQYHIPLPLIGVSPGIVN